MKKEMSKEDMDKLESSDFLTKINWAIEQAKEMVSSTLKTEVVQEDMIAYVEGFLYKTIINSYKTNFISGDVEKLELNKNDKKIIKKEFEELFKKCEGDNDDIINSKTYQTFRGKLKDISKSGYKLLLELEKHLDIVSCEKNIAKFKEEIKTLGKELKIEEGEDNSEYGISFGFEDDDEDQEEREQEISPEELKIINLKKLTNFNNFSIDIDGDYITLEDEKGYFYGQYSFSKNKKYIVAYADAQGGLDKKNKEIEICGQVYLIKDNNKILWHKNIDRPQIAFISNNKIIGLIRSKLL